MMRPHVVLIGLLLAFAAQSPSNAAVSVTASDTGVQTAGQLTFTATSNEGDLVNKVTFSYEGTPDTDEVTTAPYQIVKTMDWATMEDLTVTATFDFATIPDQSDAVDVDVVDITLLTALKPFRSTITTFLGLTDPAGISVISWEWQYNTVLLDNTWTDDANTDGLSPWSGRIVLSGTVTVDAALLGVDCSKSLNISVQDRGGIAWNTPIDGVEDNEVLWGAPLFGFNEPLGQIRDRNSNVFHIIVPQTSTGDWSDGVSTSQVTSGPNAGLWYVHGETLVIDQETVINRYMKSGGPPPEPGATNFFDYNSPHCIKGMANFVTAVEHHEYRGTPPTVKSLEGHFGRMEDELDRIGHPGLAVEPLVDTTESGLLDQVNYTVEFIEETILGFASDGFWSIAGPNWGGPGSLGSGKHTRYDVLLGGYYSGCLFGPDHF